MSPSNSERFAKPPVVEAGDDRRDLQSMLELDQETLDPDFEYRFVRDDRARIARMRVRGYRFVKQSDAEKTIVEIDDAADGLIRVGDTVLMRCPREKVELRRLENQETAEARLGAPKKKFKLRAKRSGFKTIQDGED